MRAKDALIYLALSPVALALGIALALFDVFAPRAGVREPAPPVPYDDDRDPYRRQVSG